MSNGCFVVFGCTGRTVRTYLWESQPQREYMRERAIQLAQNLTAPALVEAFIHQSNAGVQVWSNEGESK